jgi:class 3 adenylate cyclase
MGETAFISRFADLTYYNSPTERVAKLGQICLSYHRVSGAVREGQQRQRIRTGLARQVDPVVLGQISDEDLVKLQNKMLTVVFWDLSGFSALCEKLKQFPELVTEFLNEYFAQANKIIHTYNGVLDKFIGDGIMAFFGFKDKGLNSGGEDGAINAINAALKLRESFNTIKEEWIRIWKLKLQGQDIVIDLKCGANTGMVFVGLLSTEERDQFTAIGTEVNLASRLEDEAERDQIIVSRNTKEKIESDFVVKTIQLDKSKKIKGFENITEYYQITDKK